MTAALWNSDQAAAATKGYCPVPWTTTGISIDSRAVHRGDLFVALAGPRFDGHDFVGAALSRGATAAMVHRHPDGLDRNAPLLTVEDTLAGLNALGAAARNRSRARIVAVTGSVGKTGVKEALRLVLGRQGVTEASRGNLNNHWGAPLSLARMPQHAAYGVFELGMNHPGEIAPLSRLVRPHVAVITRIAPAHTEFFSSLEAVADAKAEIFEGIEPGGTAVLNRDSPYFDRLVEAARSHGIDRILSFGSTAGATAHLLAVETGATGSTVDAEVAGRQIRYRLGVPGRHWAANSLAVLAAAAALGADVELAATTLADLEAPAGRGLRLTVDLPDGSFQLIDESYNASPESMHAAFEVLALARPGRDGRRIAVLGDMLELGPDSPDRHAALADDLRSQPVDLVYAAGPNMAHLYRALPQRQRGGHAGDTAGLAPLVAELVRPGDVVMIKGSLGMNMARVVEALKARAGQPDGSHGG